MKRAEVSLISAFTLSSLPKPGGAFRRSAEDTEPPLGILSVAAVLERDGFAPHVLDLNTLASEWNGSTADFSIFAAERIATSECAVAGFSSICSSYPLTIRIAHRLKQIRPDLPVIFGGPQASATDLQTLEAFPWIDYIVRGESEQVVSPILEAILSGSAKDVLPGLSYRNAFGVQRNSAAPLISDLDQLPPPAYHLFPVDRTRSSLPVELGRGCPFACTFCSTNDFFRRRFRLKSPSVIIAEMRRLEALYGVTRFDLTHDMFTVDRRRVVEFCRAMIESGRDYYWGCSARTDYIDDELIALMYDAGCRGIFFGLETGSPRMQTVIKKKLDLDEAARVFESCSRRGIRFVISVILGFPEETREDVRQSIHYVIDNSRFPEAQPQLNLLAPLAGTPVLEQYRSDLRLRLGYSDMSSESWNGPDPEDAELISTHLDVFPNFWSPPTELDTEYLRQLEHFVEGGLTQFRWLMIATARGVGDMLALFDEWRTAYGFRSLEYFRSDAFRIDFCDFLNERLQRFNHTLVEPCLQLQCSINEAVDQWTKAWPNPMGTGRPRLAADIVIAETDWSTAAIAEKLRAGAMLAPEKTASAVALRRRETGAVEPIEISRDAAALLGCCDGNRTLEEIAAMMAFPKSDHWSPTQFCEAALTGLASAGLVSSGTANTAS